MKRAAISIAAGARKTGRNKKTFQKRENKNEGGETPLLTVLGWSFCHGRWSKERGDEELTKHETLILLETWNTDREDIQRPTNTN